MNTEAADRSLLQRPCDVGRCRLQRIEGLPVPTETGVVVVSVRLRATTDTLLGEDVRAALASADRPWTGAVAGCLALGRAGLASPGAAPATIATAVLAAPNGGPSAVGVAVARLDRVANGARHRQTGDRRGLAPPRLPIGLDGGRAVDALVDLASRPRCVP
jgi:hypothetical protein